MDSEFSVSKLPSHVGIIMDGNGRWANLRGKPRSYGHKIGSKNVETIARHAFLRGIKTLTLFAFSSENWLRPKEEVDELMRLLELYMKKFRKSAVDNKMRIVVSGDRSPLSDSLIKAIEKTEKATESFQGRTLNLAVNYGGRQEIVYAVNKLISEGKPVTESSVSEYLYTAPFGEPDLIIRTGGEIRISNFLLYQGAYSELLFTDVLWPDFDETEFDKALINYSERHRRFGKVE